MSDAGIRVELAVQDPGACPVASASATAGGTADAVARATGGPTATEEFTVAGNGLARDDMNVVFEGDGETRYRFERDPAAPCLCEAIEAEGPVVDDVRASDGTLQLTFHARDLDTARGVVESLTDAFDGVALRSLRRDGVEDTADPVVVDRGKLTDRQREVLATARELGYFEYPKGANAGEVADALGISVSTLSEHLAAAQSKVLADLFD